MGVFVIKFTIKNNITIRETNGEMGFLSCDQNMRKKYTEG